jgi:hypothetical protein
MVENEIGSKIKCLRYNNGGEFTSKEFMDYCNRHGSGPFIFWDKESCKF